MSLFVFLMVVQALVAAALVGVILMQRSEGGGLGMGGGGPTGMLSARGAADFLTRSTRMLAILFVALSIALAAVAVETSGTDEITTTIDRNVAPAGQPDSLAGNAALGGPATPAPVAGAAEPASPEPVEGPLGQ